MCASFGKKFLIFLLSLFFFWIDFTFTFTTAQAVISQPRAAVLAPAAAEPAASREVDVPGLVCKQKV
jgi:hypothetical protein